MKTKECFIAVYYHLSVNVSQKLMILQNSVNSQNKIIISVASKDIHEAVLWL